MPIFYAAPFLLVSLVCFFICLSKHSLRRYAYQSLVAPASFGFCSIIGLLGGALLWTRSDHSTHWITGLVLGWAIYLTCGLGGSWLAVKGVRFAERKVIVTDQSEALVLRLVISCIVGPIGFVLGLFVAGALLGPSSLNPAFEWAIVSGGLSGVSAYFITLAVQSRHTL